MAEGPRSDLICSRPRLHANLSQIRFERIGMKEKGHSQLDALALCTFIDCAIIST